MSEQLLFYTAEKIAKVMSLRKPQEEALQILADIFEKVNPCSSETLHEKAKKVHDLYPTITDFERDFMSLTFALATGVGKTRLMGAFITYLYCQKGIHNFFIVAPNTTIYEKLKADLGQPGTSKYVFKGLGCFNEAPMLMTEDDYRTKSQNLFHSGINLFIYNIDKFNSEDANMRKLNETRGDSFYNELAELKDLVVLMDESHHYRAKAGLKALNDLKPLLGLELTATPLVHKGSKQIPFKNVVYEYPLSEAIKDGYTRTPYALTRMNIDVRNLGEMETDRMMLNDALLFHEKIKNELRAYASQYEERLVKPFMLVVCQDTTHAERVKDFICSKEFGDGKYANKTIIVHSKLRGSESDENLKSLLSVEKAENPIEIVIHVNMLKEGWDVNNLYTIVPLRTAASQILREQMVGRGLRLPFGKRTGIKELDMVALAAHDNFEDLLAKAQAADSIFKAGNVIHAESLEKTRVKKIEVDLPLDKKKVVKDFYDTTGVPPSVETTKKIEILDEIISQAAVDTHRETAKVTSPLLDEKEKKKKIRERAMEKIQKQEKDLGNLFDLGGKSLDDFVSDRVENYNEQLKKKFIPIPVLKMIYTGVTKYKFFNFDLDLYPFTQVPVKNQIRVQNLQNMNDSETLSGHEYVELGKFNPLQYLAEKIVSYPEIDYPLVKDILPKLLNQVISHFKEKFGEEGMRNIAFMFRNQICDEIVKQMLDHRTVERGKLLKEVSGLKKANLTTYVNYSHELGLYDDYEGDIRSILFTGIEKGVFPSCKFDSKPELVLARVLEKESEVKNWLRPAPAEFNITYGNNRRYEPDFVVETKNLIYLVEVKGEDKLTDEDVLAKKESAYSYCQIVSDWAKTHDEKEWKYVFIPSKEIHVTTSFVGNLAERFLVTK